MRAYGLGKIYGRGNSSRLEGLVWVGEHLAGSPASHYIVVNLNSQFRRALDVKINGATSFEFAHPETTPRHHRHGQIAPALKEAHIIHVCRATGAGKGEHRERNWHSRAAAQALYRPGSRIISGTDEGPTRVAMCAPPKLAGPLVWGHQVAEARGR